ncbi:hypothetical protein GCM10009105_30400 [Dokdonella soli]|uniref:Dodecin domain-containing protein n=1 Tax=Dokdonella soli TaxID=529810 RepID=A0ABN1IT02_9GAMM
METPASPHVSTVHVVAAQAEGVDSAKAAITHAAKGLWREIWSSKDAIGLDITTPWVT